MFKANRTWFIVRKKSPVQISTVLIIYKKYSYYNSHSELDLFDMLRIPVPMGYLGTFYQMCSVDVNKISNMYDFFRHS